MLDQTEKPRLPVVAEIVVPQGKPRCAARQDTDFVSMDTGFDDAEVAAPVDDDGGVAGRSGSRLGVDPFERGAAEVDRDVVAPPDDRRTRASIRLPEHAHRLRDAHARLQLYR